MAIYHASMKPVSRSSGRSAVASAAYRAGERLTNERDGITHDFSRKQGVEHAEIVLPEGSDADWARDRSTLWNAAEAAENRKDARVAREFEVALPHELSAEQRLELTRDFAQELANRYGGAVDFAIHQPHDATGATSAGDVRNHHAHLLMTTRRVEAEGLGDKTYIEWKNVRLLGKGLPTTQMQLRDIRQSWEHVANEHLARAGLDIRIDHRSHMERGLEIAPTEHVGVHATQMDRKGMEVDRARLDEDAARRNADLIREKPEQVLTLITGEKSVFDRHDVARALHRYINDDPQEFRHAFAKVMASPALVELQPERADPATGEVELARYSTREMVGIESGMIESAQRMHQARNHGVDRGHVERAIERQDAAIQRSAGDMTARLSDEQRQAIEHVTGRERIAAVVGFAGAGKSTMLAAAREAWEAEGYQVHGAALSGKAAEGLEESSGIQSRTLASWSHGWENDRGTIGRGDVFVIDEAGMVGSRQLARFVGEAEARGAKIVLVGDHEQLQAIGAGAPFRAITEEIGHAELSEIRRQRVDWQREASVDFATHRTAEGLAAYQEHGNISFAETGEHARGQIVRDYLADRDERPDGTRVAMAHRRADVRAINEAIRAELQDRGELARVTDAGEGYEPRELAEDRNGSGDVARDVDHAQEGPGRALTFQTNDGKRDFATGDRIVFLQNDRELGVKNGMLATVDHVEPGRIIATLDRGDSVSVPMGDYQSIDHGYATTIHKNQGATVDRAYVLASGTMDRHLTYVAMTRHRDGAQLYAGQDEFADRHAGQTLASGRLVEHGVAPYGHQPGKSDSYFVTLENDKGQHHTIWGIDLERAMKEAAPEIGNKIGLEHRGSEPVRLSDGQMVERHTWKVRDAGELAYSQLESRLSRSGVKETTLDYTRDFAERRGIAEQMGVRSEIEIPAERAAGHRVERESTAVDPHSGDALDRRSSQKVGADLAQDLRADPREDLADDRRQRRSGFEGLKLSRGASAERPAAPDRDELAQERPQDRPQQRRGMFDGLRLNAGRGASQEPGERPGREGSLRPAPAQDRLAKRLRPQSPLEQAVDRYARAYESAHRQQREGLPILDAQRQEVREAGQQLDQVRPGARDLMRSALRYDPDMRHSLTELSGRERVGQVIERLDHERAQQADPNVRADRFVERWQELEGQRQQLRGWQHDQARGKVAGQMQDLAQSLERDPQVDSILRNRRQELGIGQHIRQSEGISHELQQSLTRGRSIGLER